MRPLFFKSINNKSTLLGRSKKLFFKMLQKYLKVIWAQCYKTFYVRNLRMFLISQYVCLWQALPAQSNVYRNGQEPTFECTTGIGSGFTRKNQTKLGKLAMAKHQLIYFLYNLRISPIRQSVTLHLAENHANNKPSNLLAQFVSYEENKVL